MGTLAPNAGGAAAALAKAQRASVIGSTSGSATATRPQGVPAEFDFSWSGAKAKVLKGLEGTPGATPAFSAFVQGELFDRLGRALVLLFVARFQREGVTRCIERARLQHLDSYNPVLVSDRLRELEEEEAAQRMAVSQPYAELILQHSSFKRPQRDRRFFEALYSALEVLLHEALARLGREAVIATELGGMFRGPFNLAAARHRPQRSVDTLGVEQIWALKHEGGNRALRGKLIASLNEKPSTLSVQVASMSNTPLVTQAVSSPIVARGILADHKKRDQMLAPPSRRRGGAVSSTGKGPAAGSIMTPFGASGSSGEQGGRVPALAGMRGAAGAAGAAAGAASRQPAPQHQAASGGGLGKCVSAHVPLDRDGRSAAASVAATPRGAGSVATALGTRASSMGAALAAAAVAAGKGMQGVVAALPEATGLPLDDALAYLILLRRHILLGPSLGLALPTAGGGGGGPGTVAGSGRLDQSPSALFSQAGG